MRTSRSSGPSLRLAWASPLPPTRSGVADYATEVIPEIIGLCDLQVVTPPHWRLDADSNWAQGLEWVGHQQPPEEGRISLLHMGNNPFHLWIAERLRHHGGTVVLHDAVLHHLLVEEAAAEGDWRRFSAEMRATYGERGAALAEAREWGITGRLDPFLFPSRAPYLSHAKGVIVHSATAARDLRAEFPDLPVRQVPLAVAALPGADRAAWRQRLGADERDLVLVHLGFLTPVKGFDVILRALLALQELDVPFRFVVVGEGVEDSAFASVAADSLLKERVVLWGFASRDDLGGIVSGADIGLVPRYPTAGETSAAALRFLAAGTPVVVSGYRQFLELPPEAALRIPPGQEGVADLVRWVSSMSANREALGRSRAAALQAWRKGGHDPALAARALLTASHEIADT